MPPARGKTATQDQRTDDPDIPDSDDDFDEDKASVEGGEGTFSHRGQAHAHRHSVGYPAHTHDGKEASYDEGETFVHGGPEAFGQERHDADVYAAEGLAEDVKTAEFETPGNISDKLVALLRDDGWTVDEMTHPNDPAGVILGIVRLTGRAISITIAYTE